MAKLLLVEDDARIASFIARGLSAEGHTVDLAANGATALELARAHPYPLLILDRMLPDMDGAEVCATLRAERYQGRILILTAKDAAPDRIGGLRAGADDYLTKPFAFDELILRIEALLRRGEIVRHEAVLSVGDLTMNPATRRVARGDRVIDLTPKEYALLRYLMENPGRVLSRAQILNNNWGYSFDPGTKVVDVYVRYLRQKVDGPGERPLIQTVRGVGYKVCEQD